MRDGTLLVLWPSLGHPSPPSLPKPLALATDNPTQSKVTFSVPEFERNKDREKGERVNRVFCDLDQTGCVEPSQPRTAVGIDGKWFK